MTQGTRYPFPVSGGNVEVASRLQITSQNQAQDEKVITTSIQFSPFQVNAESCSCQSSDES